MRTKSALFKKLIVGLTLSTLTNFSTATANEPAPEVAVNSDSKAQAEAQTNLNYLFGKTLQKSKVLQETHGDFAPYGAALFRNGSVKYVWYAKPGETVKNPALSLPFIRKALQTQAMSGQIIGSAVVYKYIKEDKPQPLLTVELEYYSGLTMAFAAEMMVDESNKVSWGSNNQGPLEPKVFIAQTDQ